MRDALTLAIIGLLLWILFGKIAAGEVLSTVSYPEFEQKPINPAILGGFPLDYWVLKAKTDWGYVKALTPADVAAMSYGYPPGAPGGVA